MQYYIGRNFKSRKVLEGWFSCLPHTTSEIREMNRPAFVGYRVFAQLGNYTPGGCIIDIHIRRASFTQAFDESIVLYVIHTAVTFAFGLLADFFPEFVFILLGVIFKRLPFMFRASCLNMDFLLRVFSDDAICALYENIAAVRAR